MKKLTKQQVTDLLTTALEGGSNYWYLLNVSNKEIPSTEYLCNYVQGINGNVTVFDVENPNDALGSININSIKKGSETMLAQYPKHYADILAEQWDAETADVWFQLVVMGEIVFG